MADAVLDASAVLAYLRSEPGANIVAAVITRSVLSSVNAAEVLTKLVARGAAAEAATMIVQLLPCPIVAVDAILGLRAGALSAQTAAQGLSLGDRVCLALAEREGVPAVTADAAWAQTTLTIGVQLIR